MEKGIKNICFNKKAGFDYFLETTFEAGIVLEGSEIKSIRNGNVNLKDSHIQIKNEEAFIINMHVSPYVNGSVFNPDPTRTRKLLLNKREIIVGTKNINIAILISSQTKFKISVE